MADGPVSHRRAKMIPSVLVEVMESGEGTPDAERVYSPIATLVGPASEPAPAINDAASNVEVVSESTVTIEAECGIWEGIFTLAKLGWGNIGVVDEIYERWSEMADLPLEEASLDRGSPVTEAERDNIPKLREAILRKLGLSAPPSGFPSHHFTPWKLLCMLRAREGDVERAAERAVLCIPSVELIFNHARAFEAAPAEHRRLRQMKINAGLFGIDRRGAPVFYSRFGRSDTPGLALRTSIGFMLASEFYMNLMIWESGRLASERRGVSLQGSLFVLDISGLGMSQAYSAYKVVKQMLSDPAYAEGEHPMPEGMRKTLVCGAASWIGRIWTLVKPLLPTRTANKVSLFRADHQDDFLQELLSRVDADQIPQWCGGQATEPWPYGPPETT